jgi:hypothetical protein
MKDPAFLFYSRDFYEGTRTMLPEERACLTDLLIYQHQNGFIPNDIDRVAMYCSGISKSIVEATLKAKFKPSPQGWYNEKLKGVVTERSAFSEKQSANGKIGQFWKAAKKVLTAKEVKIIKIFVTQNSLSNIDFIENYGDYLNDPKGMLKLSLNNKANVDAIENVNTNEKESETKKEETLLANNQKVWAELQQRNPELPTQDAELHQLWQHYTLMRWQAHRFSYHSTHTERQALENLLKLARGKRT